MAAGGGKSHALLMDALKYIDDPHFYAVYFRRTTQQLERSLWPEAKNMYLPFLVDENGKFMGKAKIREKDHKIVFPSGATLEFSYMEHDKDAQLNWQGAQLTGVYWDEFCHFSEYQFNYLRTRLRSKSKYPSFMRASMNPDSGHFVVKWIDAWLDEDGFPDRSISGKTRYFIFNNGELITHWDKQYLLDNYPKQKPRTYTFVPSLLSDNPKMLEVNPDYEEELSANSRVERETLLNGCWNVKVNGASYFKREWVKPSKLPLHTRKCRGYDLAATEPHEGNTSPDFTASIQIHKDKDGFYYIVGHFHPNFTDEGTEVYGRCRKRVGARNNLIKLQAVHDGEDCPIVIPLDPGPHGKESFQRLATEMQSNGFRVKQDPAPRADKLTKGQPFLDACENGLVFIVVDSFPNKTTFEAYLKDMENFDNEKSTKTKHDDWFDCTASAFNYICREMTFLPIGLPSSHIATKKKTIMNG